MRPGGIKFGFIFNFVLAFILIFSIEIYYSSFILILIQFYL
jgi:hypothetical protein